MPDKIVNHFVLADGSVARYDYDGLLNAPDVESFMTDTTAKLDDIYTDNLVPFTVSEGHTIGADGVEIANSNIRVVYFDVNNAGAYFLHNISRRSMASNSIVCFDSNGDVVSGGATFRYDYPYISFIAGSTTKKIAVATWNVGHTTTDGTLYDEPYITQLAITSTNSPLLINNAYPFVSNLYNKKYVTANLLQDGTFSNSNSAIRCYGYIPVNEGDTITVTFPNTTQTVTNLRHFIQYYDLNFGFLSFEQYGTGTFTAPSNCKYFLIWFFATDIDNVVIKVRPATVSDLKIDDRVLPLISSTDIHAYPVFASINNNVAELTFKYSNTKDMTVQMQKQGGLDENNEPTGGNQLFDFCRWFLTDNNDTAVTNSPDTSTAGKTAGTDYQISGTDYFAPYRVRAVNNADGDKSTNNDFTGGNHQYNNSGSGSTATARTANLVFKVDGRQVSSFSGYCRNVLISWDNYIQGNNTKKADGTGREILKEHYTILFDGNKFHVENKITALEDIYIYTYYGEQMKNQYAHINAYNIEFLGSKTTKAPINKPASGLAVSGDKCARDVVNTDTNNATLFLNNVAEMGIEDVGLGDFDYAKTIPSSCLASSGKLYFNLINAFDHETNTIDMENVLNLSSNDVIYYRGWYKFHQAV